MKEAIRRLFEEQSVEYAEAIPFSLCRVIHEGKLARLPFVPQTAILMAIPYYVDRPPQANLSLYAMSEDYHFFFRGLFEVLVDRLKERFPCASFAPFADASPIDERDAAVRCGLGVLGENGLLINEKYASFVFLGEILTDLSYEAVGDKTDFEIRRCEGCGACRRACPKTDLCLSALTQKKGALSRDEKETLLCLGSVWGCDLCQVACPHSRNAAVTPFAFFHQNRISRLTKEILLGMSEEEFSRRAFAWRGRNTILRNLELFSHPSTEGQTETADRKDRKV